jgi:endonuclease G
MYRERNWNHAMQYLHKNQSLVDVIKRLATGAALAVGLATTSLPASAWLVSSAVEHAATTALLSNERHHASDNVAAPVALPAAHGFSACAQIFPSQVPLDIRTVNADWKPTALCANHFAVLYSALSKTPLVVVERLNRAQIGDAGNEPRTNLFYPDPRLPGGARAELSDYLGSGYDRGHQAPAGDEPDPTSMAQSFVLSNMVPQDPTNNRKIWAKIEKDVRKFVRRAQGEVFVFTGPLFVGERRTIGANKVWVPSHLFKLVYDEASGRSWAYILPNTADARIEAPMDYAAFVRQTGWSLLGNVSASTQPRRGGEF